MLHIVAHVLKNSAHFCRYLASNQSAHFKIIQFTAQWCTISSAKTR